MTSRQSVFSHDIGAYLHLMAVAVLCIVVASTASAQTSRIKRISLMTPDLDRSIAFFTEVIGFRLDFEGTLPPGGEPFLGPVFKIDAGQPIRRALLSTKTEPRGLFLIEHEAMPQPDHEAVNAVVTVIQVPDLYGTLTAAGVFGAMHSDVMTDVTPEGLTFGEALIISPGGHAVLVYEIGASSNH